MPTPRAILRVVFEESASLAPVNCCDVDEFDASASAAAGAVGFAADPDADPDPDVEAEAADTGAEKEVGGIFESPNFLGT